MTKVKVSVKYLIIIIKNNRKHLNLYTNIQYAYTKYTELIIHKYL